MNAHKMDEERARAQVIPLRPAAAPRVVAIVETREEPHRLLYRVYHVEAPGGDFPFAGIWSQAPGGAPKATPQKLMTLELDAVAAGVDFDGARVYRQ